MFSIVPEAIGIVKWAKIIKHFSASAERVVRFISIPKERIHSMIKDFSSNSFFYVSIFEEAYFNFPNAESTRH